MASYFQSYAINRGSFPDYPRYFLDTVKEIIADRNCESIIYVRDNAHLREPRVVLSTEDENALRFVQSAIESEIKTFPFSCAASIPFRIIEGESSEAEQFRQNLSAMTESRDYQIYPDVEDGEEHAVFSFHRRSHLEYFARLLAPVWYPADPADEVDQTREAADTIPPSDTNKVVSLFGANAPRRPTASSAAEPGDASVKVVSLDEMRRSGSKSGLGTHRLT